MIRNSHFVAVFFVASLSAGPAHARFGKGGGGSGNRGSSSSSSSQSSSSHGAAPIGSVPRSSSGRGSFYGGSYNGGRAYYGSAWHSGYYSGAFVPMYGYGYGFYAMNPYGYGYGNPSYASPYAVSRGVRQEPSSLRVTLGIEAMPYLGSDRGGFGLGGAAMFEGERWGVSLGFQNIAAPSGSSSLDTIQQFNAHGTFAFLTGRYGRLRVELGGDSFFAADLIVLAPTGGLSGTLWIAGPVALEASVMVTPWPIRQLDLRGGVVVGLGPIGLRAGWRTQVLDDQGLVDGIVNRDTFMGPYAGMSLAF